MTSKPRPVLVCTLGGKAQVATFTIDALLQQNIEIGKVVILHHAPTDSGHRLRQAVDLLQRHIRVHYQNKIQVELVAVENKHGMITDLTDTNAMSAAWETLNQTIGHLKGYHPEMHFCFTGGRRLLAMQAMSVLSLHATPADSLWHLYTSEALQHAAGTNQVLHATERPELEQPYVMKVPLVAWAYFFKGLRQLLHLNPLEAIEKTPFLDDRDETCVRTVWAHLTTALQDTLYLLAKGNLPQAVAKELGVSVGTVQGYVSDIRQECRTAWGLDASHQLSYDWFPRKFGSLIDSLPRKGTKLNEKIG